MNRLLTKVLVWPLKVELFMAMLFLQCCDLVTTYMFRSVGHPEGNWLFKQAAGGMDWQAVFILKAFGLCISWYLLYFATEKKIWLFKVVLWVYIGVAFWNIFRTLLEVLV